MKAKDLAAELLRNPEFEVLINPTSPDMRFEREPVRELSGVTSHQGRNTYVFGVGNVAKKYEDPLEEVTDGGVGGIIQGWK